MNSEEYYHWVEKKDREQIIEDNREFCMGECEKWLKS